MFVSTPPQISADAAQTGSNGPSAPADAGSGGGFAAWLPGSAQPGGETPTGAAPLQGADGTIPPPQFSPFGLEVAAGALGQSNQATAEAAVTTGFQKGAGTAADMLLQTAFLTKGDGQANQSANPLAGQQGLAQSGAELGLMASSKSGTTAATTQTDADTAETVLNRLGVPAMPKEMTDPLAKRAAAFSSTAAEPFGSAQRVSSDGLPQSQTQLATLPQSTDSGFRPQLSQGGLTQSQTQGQGQDGTGRPNPTINSPDIAVQMARNKAAGNNQFTIRLTPESMGTITVKLNIANNANLTAQLTVEKPETLALLQKDMAGLEKALKAQGFTTGDGDLTIALKSSAIGVRGGEAAMNSGADQRFSHNQNTGQNMGQNQSQAQGQTNAQNQGSSTAAQQAPSSPAPTGGMDRPAPGMLSSGDMGFQQSHHEQGTHGHEGFEQNPNGQGQPEPDEQDMALLEHAELIANAYHGNSLLIGMSTQLDLSV
ncbi:flagellar hook-length control protein FliK [Pararhizobium sp. IMCC21322]|uniref:flagellar hook-length control protein FliK n=1 Tax=Pararhizobium sp. IMCC21322 TaxID=3067903 RepID=UPI0027404BC4|nr:flagellar hook-length control protein FliK [Pararhizobium sp. IMCC21322]